MKSKLIAVLAILLAVASGFSGLVQAKQVTQNSYEDSSPCINRNYLVWQGQVGGNWEIFLYDISDPNAAAMQITDNGYGNISPQTDGNYVVWLGFSASGGEIFLYNISTQETLQITNDSDIDSRPQIANGKVVWTSQLVDDPVVCPGSVCPGEIILYDIQSGIRTVLSSYDWIDPNNQFDDSSPRISEEKVVWNQPNGISGVTLYVFDLNSLIEEDLNPTAAPGGFIWEDSSQTHGNFTVYSRVVGSDREIFLRKVDANGLSTSQQITDNDIPDKYPRINGTNIVWVGGTGQAAEIFLVSYNYTFDGLTSMLQTLVEAGSIEPQMQTSLLSKVENAKASADRENICAAINQLEALMNQVTAQDGKKVVGEAGAIIDYTNGVIDWLLTKLPAGESC